MTTFLPKVVVCGLGFGGLEAALRLKSLLGDRVEVVAVDQQSSHVFIPAIHQVVSDQFNLEKTTLSLRKVLASNGIQFVNEPITAIRNSERVVATATQSLKYDYLVIALGSETNYYNIPGLREHAFGFKTVNDVIAFKRHLLNLLAQYEAETEPAARSDLFSIAVCGGGLTGVELITEIHDLFRLLRRLKGIPKEHFRLTLVEAYPRILHGHNDKVQTFVTEFLKGEGIEVVTGKRVMEAKKEEASHGSAGASAGRGGIGASDPPDREEVGAHRPPQMKVLRFTDGSVIKAHTLVWCGGVKPNDVILKSDLTLHRRGGIIVNTYMQSVDDHRVYAVGDCIYYSENTPDRPVTYTAHNALFEAKCAAINIARDVKGKYRKRRYIPSLDTSLISLGKEMTVLSHPRFMLKGRLMVWLKRLVMEYYFVWRKQFHRRWFGLGT
jgi:NADH dehydrogenase